MPLYDYLCMDCGEVSEILVTGADNMVSCSYCESKKVKKLLSAHSSFSGGSKHSMPGPGDTGCCGSSPGHATGCAGPGSCCGKGPS